MKCLALAVMAALMTPAALWAQDKVQNQISVELNATQSQGSGCKLSFVVQNGFEAPVDKAVYEAVLFDKNGQVDRLMLFDFGKLPASRPRVRQFVVPELSCETLGQVLVNGVHHCGGDALPEGACMQGLKLGSRVDVEMLG